MRSIFCLIVIGLVAGVMFAPASASDYVLQVFGNVNMDDIVDAEDIEYLKGILNGTKDATEFADANYDGKID